MKILLLAFVSILAFTFKDPLTGRWESKPSEKGNVTGVVFKNGNTMEGYVNKKPFVSGTYSYNELDSIFSFIDNGCDGIRATYKIIFFGNSDSIRFSLINDSCNDRRNGMLRLIMGRVK